MTLRDELEKYRAWLATRSRQTIDRWDIIDKLDALLSTADSEQRECVCDPKYSATDEACPACARPAEQREVVDLADETLPLMPTGKYTRPTEQREVADLRRKLEEAVSEKKVAWDRMAVHNKDADDAVSRAELAMDNERKARVEEAQKASSLSLANAALRTALESIEHKGCTEDAHIARQALEDVALPADSLAQEVVDVLKNIRPEFETGSWQANDIDALLARIGGKS